MGDMATVKVLKNAIHMRYNGIFGCHGNTCYVILIGNFFCLIHNIGSINVFTDFEINRYKIDEFRKTRKNPMFYLTSHDAKTVRRMSWGLVFMFSVTLTFDLCSILVTRTEHYALFVVCLLDFYWMFYDHFSARSLLAKLGRWGWWWGWGWLERKARRH